MQELQAEDAHAQKIMAEKCEGWEDNDGVLHHQSHPYVPEIIRFELISRIELISNNPLEKKPLDTYRRDVESYVREC